MMTMRERSFFLDEAGNPHAEPGSREWSLFVRGKIQEHLKDQESNARHLREWVTAIQEHAGYRALTDARGRPFIDFVDFCQARPPAGLGMEPDRLEATIEARIAKAAADTTGEVQQRGGDRKSEAAKSKSTVDFDSKADRAAVNGVSRFTQHRIDRIARERPDLKAEIVAGRLSVKKAAQIAGFEPVRMAVPVEPAQLAAALAKRYDAYQLAALVAALLKHLTGDALDNAADLVAMAQAGAPALRGRC